MDYDEILHARQTFEGQSVALSYQRPLHIVRAKGCRMYEEADEAFLDCVNNVAHVGHSNPQVRFAGKTLQPIQCGKSLVRSR